MKLKKIAQAVFAASLLVAMAALLDHHSSRLLEQQVALNVGSVCLTALILSGMVWYFAWGLSGES